MSLLSNQTQDMLINNITQIVNEISNSAFQPYDPIQNLQPMNTTDNFHEKTPHTISSEPEKFLSAKSLIVIVIILIHTIAAPIFEKLHFHYIHESGISMLLGMIVGLLAFVINPTVYNFF